MMLGLSILDHLAARDDSDSGVKVVFGIIVAVIWGIGAIMSAMKKKGQQDAQQYVQQDWSHLLRDLTAGQNKPFNPNTPAPPQVLPPPMRPQQQFQRPQQAPRPQPPQRQQVKSFAQQSPRPFVQQYRPKQIPQRPAPQIRKAIQPPKPIQKRPKAQRRQPPPIPQAVSVPRPPEAQVGLIQDATVTMGPIGGATSVQTSTARAGHGPLTRGQLRKLILWSEILSEPLSLR
jgi:hypothetical protein